MVFTCRVRMWATISRRRVLAGAAGAGAAVALAGCGPFGTAEPPAAAPASPLEPVLAGARALISRYQSILAAQPELTDSLNPLLAEHQTHVEALLAAMGRPAGSGSPTAAPDSSAPTDPAAARAAAARRRAGRPGRRRERLRRGSGDPGRADRIDRGGPGHPRGGAGVTLADALAAEHAAIWGYGVLGAHLTGPALDRPGRPRRRTATGATR